MAEITIRPCPKCGDPVLVRRTVPGVCDACAHVGRWVVVHWSDGHRIAWEAVSRVRDGLRRLELGGEK
jgi:hypothetical protein